MNIASPPANGHKARSSKTRSHLIEAAIEVIGAVGYEGASTRALAKTANTTLSAIPHHFGGKKELYLAAADMIAEHAAGRFDKALDPLDDNSIADKTVRLEQALTNFLNIILENAEPYSWTSFVARCTYDNDEAFTVIYERAIAPMLERLVQTASDVSGRAPDDEALRLRISAIVTSIISFRFLRGIILRGMAWSEIQSSSIGQIEGMVRDLCRSDFLAANRTK
ncbi:CerR family C-terminal domain-containing protein [Thalassospira alkalitolerans]|uniref:CerR family C-terminal domain-containing protein n=1 Tax=Thalassospira alkalitolerans TaxID=1293890 RepID=UPI0030EE31B4|tara:strand:+ start:131071 stop:131742 length:672 start_codon:yes stop_codon:yes gene_type:complete